MPCLPDDILTCSIVSIWKQTTPNIIPYSILTSDTPHLLLNAPIISISNRSILNTYIRIHLTSCSTRPQFRSQIVRYPIFESAFTSPLAQHGCNFDLRSFLERGRKRTSILAAEYLSHHTLLTCRILQNSSVFILF